ncbi:MAG TPA: hypothetical protein VMV46_02295 [Thermoanaerobaculia bacterium]|nr:hypothetical protein [Thermoanaerobaculia bacterium]
MRRRLLLLRVALLVAGVLLLGTPVAAVSPGAAVDAPAVGVTAPEPIPDDDATPTLPRFSSSPRSTIADTSAGPQPFLHPATLRCTEPSGSRAGAAEAGAAQQVRSSRALFLVLCSFLN